MSDPNEQIGSMLRQARQAAGLELAEAARQAQVPRAAAEALEAEDFSYFSSPVYAKSFLLQYSGFLKVNAAPWLDALAPGSFMASGALLKGPEVPSRRDDDIGPDERSGMMGVIVLLLLTAATVVGLIKGCEFFESRFAEDPARHQNESGDQLLPSEGAAGSGLPDRGGVR